MDDCFIGFEGKGRDSLDGELDSEIVYGLDLDAFELKFEKSDGADRSIALTLVFIFGFE
jgi:hypothetical protein